MSSKIKIFMKVLSLVIASLSIVACTAQSPTTDTPTNNSTISNVTTTSTETYDLEEQKAPINSENSPISSYWFPEELLSWNASEDKDLEFNKSKIPLAKRVDKEKQYPVNETQNKDTKVVAISIMNANTSGNLSQGTNQFASNTFSYWQYIDKLVYWGGSSGEGLIIPPSPEVTDAAHKNGVSTLGTVFFPMLEHGGKMEWLDQFLQKDADGKFPMVDKLIEVATTYGFDGWFINQETQGDKKAPLTSKHATDMQEFIKQFKEKAGDTLEIMWYDSMTKDGEMDWQNAVTDKNEMFLIDSDKKPISDSMFLNFWWTNKSEAEKELLKASEVKSEEIGFNPKEVYAGIDLQSKGTLTPIRWDLLEKQTNETFTSIGLYCPSWTFFSSNGNVDEFEDKEAALWVNEFKNPAQPTAAKGTEWKGISTYVVEKSVVRSVPFETNFNMGNGYNFFINGEKISTIDWSNRSLADVMPTYRWIMEHEGNNNLTANIDYSQAYYGGNSIKFRGSVEEAKSSTIKLFSADLTLEKGNTLRAVAKSDQPASLDLFLEFHDGSKEQIKGDKALGSDWTTVTYPIEKAVGKPIKTIGFVVSSTTAQEDFIMNLGNITIDDNTKEKVSNIQKLTVEDVMFQEDDTIAGVRLNWEASEMNAVKLYEISKVDSNKQKTFLGATPNNRFFVNGLLRETAEQKTTFEVVAVNKDNVRGKTQTVEIQWPDNTIPKANFKSDKTVVGVGGEIAFTNMSNLLTESVEWKFPGATVETSTELNPKVTYDKEGVYDVTLIAKNEKGVDEKVATGLITVTNAAQDGLVNLSLGKSVEASSFVNNNEKADFAIDGVVETKWCAVGPDEHNITIDLGEVKAISEVHIAHAQAGGESDGMNTQEYKLEVSVDGKEFTEVLNVIKNTSGTTVDSFKNTDARYVKLTILKATQGSDSAARIYEVSVYGLK